MLVTMMLPVDPAYPKLQVKIGFQSSLDSATKQDHKELQHHGVGLIASTGVSASPM